MRLAYYTEKQVESALGERTAFQLAEQAFRFLAEKKALMPPKIYLRLPGPEANDFRAMPAAVLARGHEAAGVKWVCVFPQNPKRGLPTVFGTVLLNSPHTGRPLALVEAGALTAIRTAAASAVATRYLANPSPRRLALIGAGRQAGYQLKAIGRIARFREIGVWGFRPAEAESFCRRWRRVFPQLEACADIRACVQDADVIVTSTPSRRPLIRKAWVKRGAHINAIGADAKGKQELDPALLFAARVVADQWEQASHSGEINVSFWNGSFKRRHLHAELGEIVAGRRKGRTGPREITIFDSTGLAVLDIHFANHAVRTLR